MAFSKIAGFDVTPPRPSSSTRRLSSPPAIRLRRMKSSHTDWPYCLRAATGLATAAVSEGDWLMAILRSRRRLAVALLERGDLGEAPPVPLPGGVARPEEGAHEIAGQSRPHDPPAEHEDVHVVVFHTLVRRVRIVADRRADAGKLVGGDACADAAPADEDAALGASADHRRADGFGEVRIVHGLGGVGSHVQDVVPVAAQSVDD